MTFCRRTDFSERLRAFYSERYNEIKSTAARPIASGVGTGRSVFFSTGSNRDGSAYHLGYELDRLRVVGVRATVLGLGGGGGGVRGWVWLRVIR